MQISEKNLRRIIRKKILFEQSPETGIPDPPSWESFSSIDDMHERYKEQMKGYNQGTELKHPMSNATVLAGRFINALQHDKWIKKIGFNPHHSWVILYDENGEIETWFTGKTDENIIPGGLRTATRAIGGRSQTDAFILACERPSAENAKNTEWGALEGFERVGWDNPMTAEAKWLVSVPGVSKEEIKRKVRSAFGKYKGTNPYDFLPGSLGPDTACGRNSNSFAHSLVRHAGASSGKSSFIPLPGTGEYSANMFPGEQLQIDGVSRN